MWFPIKFSPLTVFVAEPRHHALPNPGPHFAYLRHRLRLRRLLLQHTLNVPCALLLHHLRQYKLNNVLVNIWWFRHSFRLVLSNDTHIRIHCLLPRDLLFFTVYFQGWSVFRLHVKLLILLFLKLRAPKFKRRLILIVLVPNKIFAWSLEQFLLRILIANNNFFRDNRVLYRRFCNQTFHLLKLNVLIFYKVSQKLICACPIAIDLVHTHPHYVWLVNNLRIISFQNSIHIELVLLRAQRPRSAPCSGPLRDHIDALSPYWHPTFVLKWACLYWNSSLPQIIRSI